MTLLDQILNFRSIRYDSVKQFQRISLPKLENFQSPPEKSRRCAHEVGHVTRIIELKVQRSQCSTISSISTPYWYIRGLGEHLLMPNYRSKYEDESSNDVDSVTVNRRGAQFVPPLNFALVEDGIYRSGFPMPINYPFLQQLKIKTIIYLGDLGHSHSHKKKDKHGTAEIMDQYEKWIETTDITLHKLSMDQAQEPFTSREIQEKSYKALATALQLLLDKHNFPILVHSNKGKHRTGLLIGLVRKLLQGWCLSGIFDEYEKFAMGKSEFDLETIEMWQPDLWVDEECKPAFVRI